MEQARRMHEETEERGRALGIAFDFRRARRGNTFDAHRVIQMARDHGVQDAVNKRLMAAYFSEGGAIGDRATLADAAGTAGLDRSAVAEMLESDRYAADVRSDEREAAALGITAVPFFVLDRRYGVEGAQPAEVLLEAMRTALADRAESSA
jgi:predicted DsbA family dithiol-disulfide isomerase